MKTGFTAALKALRQKKGLRMIDVSHGIGLDQALVSKFESGKRQPNREQVMALAHFFEVEPGTLLVPWMTERILHQYGSDALVLDALKLAEQELTYQLSRRSSGSYPKLDKVLDEIDALKGRLDQEPALKNVRIAEALELEYTFNSNRIEGNTLTLQETQLVIQEGLTISGKSMREHLEAINHNEAIDFIKSLASPGSVLNERVVKQIHQLVLRGIDPENAGVYRNVPVIITGSAHMPPQPYLVAKKMEELFEWYTGNRTILHPVHLAAEMHERLVSIHPFIDGNGRTSRLVMNLILIGAGYPIANIQGDSKSRLRYFEALEKARSSESNPAFNLFIAKTELACLKRLEKLMG